ncbi:hypothetical protein BDW59DRAFT_126865 [Aspergillus cavernicola]|uniref:Uncharacterized protein n=1 Tax=Aspergillus cavernicola TaxID=176166 RepID=A0ABR4HTX5_9EURO
MSTPKATKPRVVMDPQNLRPRQQPPSPRPRPPSLPVKDIRQTREYKSAARRWISTIVALPILMYTSYVLFERTYGNQKPKRLADVPRDSSSSEHSE